MVDYRDLGVAEQGRELVRSHIAIAIDGDRQVSLAPQLFGDRGEGVVGVDETARKALSPSSCVLYSAGTRSNHGCAVSS